jgi:cbb3-type cytochrome oxidase subunit 3
MKIEMTKVTRFSQAAALVLFVGVFLLGIYLGMKIEQKHVEDNAAVTAV